MRPNQFSAIFALTLVCVIVTFANLSEAAPSGNESIEQEPAVTALSTTTSPGDSQESTKGALIEEDEIILISFNGDASNATDATSPKETQNNASKIIQKRSPAFETSPENDITTAGSMDDNRNGTSKGNSSETVSVPVILIPFIRPRPILIDVIFFHVNKTGINGSDPRFPSVSRGHNDGHSDPINSDEDAGPAMLTQDPHSTTEGPDSLESSSERGKSTTARDHSNRRRRDTIFSHFTNNSQAATFPPKNAGMGKSFDTLNNETLTQPSSTLEPTLGETMEPHFDHDNKTSGGTDGNNMVPRNSSSSASASSEEENPVFGFVLEIIEYGANVTKALLGKKVDSGNANSNRTKAFGTDDE